MARQVLFGWSVSRWFLSRWATHIPLYLFPSKSASKVTLSSKVHLFQSFFIYVITLFILSLYSYRNDTIHFL